MRSAACSINLTKYTLSDEPIDYWCWYARGRNRGVSALNGSWFGADARVHINMDIMSVILPIYYGTHVVMELSSAYSAPSNFIPPASWTVSSSLPSPTPTRSPVPSFSDPPQFETHPWSLNAARGRFGRNLFATCMGRWYARWRLRHWHARDRGWREIPWQASQHRELGC